MGWYQASATWENWIGLPQDDFLYTRQLASAKVDASKYLTYGRLWRQPEWEIPTEMMQLHDYGYMEHDWKQTCPTPKVLAECWLAHDGTFAVVATNHGDSELMLNVSVDVSATGAAAPVLVQLVKAMPSRSIEVLPVVVPA
jgi:hypothetical protein